MTIDPQVVAALGGNRLVGNDAMELVVPLGTTEVRRLDLNAPPPPGWSRSARWGDEHWGALFECLTDMQDVNANQTADTGQYRYDYADLASVLRYARPLLAKNGFLLMQAVETEQGRVVVTSTFMHRTGAWLAAPPFTVRCADTAQGAGSGMTYARRYSALAALGVATADDDGHDAQPASPPAQNRGRTTVSRPNQASAPQATNQRRQETTAPQPRDTNRSRQEAETRALMARLPPEDVRKLQHDFLTEFHMPLSALPVEDHQRALDYVAFWVGAPPVDDAPPDNNHIDPYGDTP